MNDRPWLFALVFAAMIFFLPWTGDPYYMPRLALVAAICVPMLLMSKERSSGLTVYVLFGMMMWLFAASFSQDQAYTTVGAFAASFDCLTAVSVLAAVTLGVGRLNVTAEDVADVVVMGSIPLSAYSILQRIILTRDPFLQTNLPGLTRVVATQGWPVYLGAMLAISAACALGSFRRRPVLATVALIFALPAIGFTGTRGALAAVILAAFVVVPGRAKWLALLLSPFAYLMRAGALRSDTNRVENYKIAWHMFKDHILFGTGPGTYPVISRQYITDSYILANHSTMIASQHAHHQVLHVLATTGLVGLIGYGIVLLGCWRVARDSEHKTLLITVVVAYAVVASLNPVPFSVTVLMAMLFGAASSIEGAVEDLITPMALAFMCLVSVFLAGRIVLADYYLRDAVRIINTKDRIAMVRDVNMAAKLNPWELRITSLQVDGLMPTSIEAAVEAAHQGVLMHLNDSSAHEVYGRAVLMGAQAGKYDPRQALLAFNHAQKLAPTFMPLMFRRRALAMGLGNAHEAIIANADLIRMQNLERN